MSSRVARAAAPAVAAESSSPLAAAIEAKGVLGAHRWLIARRWSQAGILALFLAGPWAGLWLVKGNLSSSLTLEVLPLTDPYLLLQSLAAGHVAGSTAALGALIVVAFYLLAGGRAYCAWVCPVNVLTDTAAWLRRKLGLRRGRTPPRALRYWLLGATLAAAFATGTIAWELVNPVSMLYRGILFGLGLAWAILGAVFLFDLLVAPRGWCSHVCPVGAFYALLGRFALVRVSARRSGACDDCADCYRVCPEPHVIVPALKGAASPVIRSGDCTNCGRCIDACSKDVFRFTIRFDQRRDPS
ncbi:MAG: quinol dehydrogenase ferredoxin subunit NapH [Burkholderiales bacterium]|nr:quinol dehydrogenase ferredoxin subunit NapH [Burkholderiales bacterium]